LAYPDLLVLPYNNDFSLNYLNQSSPSFKLDQFGEFISKNSSKIVFVYYEKIRTSFYEKALEKYGFFVNFKEINRFNIEGLLSTENSGNIVVYEVFLLSNHKND
jgi:hypothetical protein